MKYKEYNQKLFKMKRNALNMTAEEIGEICHLTKGGISCIENGKSKNKATITFIGFTLDMLAKEKGDMYVKLFDGIEKLNI